MTFEEARLAAAELLEQRGQLLNGHLLRLVNGDKSLFREVRESLIRDSCAEDRSGVGLAFILPAATAEIGRSTTVSSSAGEIWGSDAPPFSSGNAIPEVVDPGLADENLDWWVMAAGVVKGPFDDNTFQRMRQLGEIVAGDVVRRGIRGLWHRPTDLPRLPRPLVSELSSIKSTSGVTANDSPGPENSLTVASVLEQSSSENHYVPPEKSWSHGGTGGRSWIRHGWDLTASVCGGSKRLTLIILTLTVIGLSWLWWKQPPPAETIYKEFAACYSSLQKLRERRIGRSEWAPTVDRYRPRVKGLVSRLQFQRSSAEKELYQAGKMGLLPLLDIPSDPTNFERVFDKHMAAARRDIDQASVK